MGLLAKGPARDDQDAGQQLLGSERDGQDVVNACLKSVQLGLHIATPGKTDYGQADLRASPEAIP